MSKHLYLIAASAAVVALTAACSSSGSGNSSSPSAPTSPASTASQASSVVVAVSSGALVAPDGHTLYEFSKDTATSVACIGGCTSIWPPLDGTPKGGSGVAADELGTVVRPDGTHQVTFAGHPLYEYSGDQAAGERHGEGVTDNGGIWHVALSSGTQPTSTTMSSSSNSYGY
jgi:predicted lipoprotein with Yx(FWY)xxD motif